MRAEEGNRSSHSLECPFFTGDRDQSCMAVAGCMRCSLFEIEHYCQSEGHAFCPVFVERTRNKRLVSVEFYRERLVEKEFQQTTA